MQVSQVTQTGKQAKQWRCGLGLMVALQLAMPVTLDSNFSLYHIFGLFFIAFTRLGLGLVFWGLGFSILSLRCSSTAGRLVVSLGGRLYKTLLLLLLLRSVYKHMAPDGSHAVLLQSLSSCSVPKYSIGRLYIYSI